MPSYPTQINVRPTKSGNGFTAGKVYNWEWHKRSVYRCLNDNGHERFECYSYDSSEPFGPRSPHLWDGSGVYEFTAGRWEPVIYKWK